MLLVTVKALVTIPQDCKIATDSMSGTYTDVRIWTVVTSAAAVVGKMNAKRCTLRCWVVGELTIVGGVGAVALQEIPTDGDFSRIVLIHTSKATAASACKYKVL